GLLRALDPGGEADRLHHLVPGEPGMPPLREAAAHEPRVARAATGTPDPAHADDGATTCVTDALAWGRDPVETGSRSSCKSSWGVFDMVGNLAEWVADWADKSEYYAQWTSSTAGYNKIAGDDWSASGGPGYDGTGATAPYNADPEFALPAALVRGGGMHGDVFAGVFSVDARYIPSDRNGDTGFRCAR